MGLPAVRTRPPDDTIDQMAFTTEEREKCEADLQLFMDRRRPPEDIRDELDLAYRIEGQSIVIFEIRPRWDEPEETVESPVAKTTYVRTKNHWRVFWQRADLKWHRYDPASTVASLAEFLDLVDRDEYSCFWG